MTEEPSASMGESPAFTRYLSEFLQPRGAHLTERLGEFGAYLAARGEERVWPYARTLEGPPRPAALLRGPDGSTIQGLNFASQDYLGLCSHPGVLAAAQRALEVYGPHSASSPMFQGNTGISRELEDELADLLGMAHVLLFSTGWGAGFGSIAGLIRPYDHVLIDRLAHSCLVQGARAATPNVHVFPHNDREALRRTLGELRARDPEGGALVVTEGLFSMDSDSPDLPAFQRLCREHGAVLLVDVAHDLGASGPGGTGQLGAQGALGEVDLVMGSFSKTFANNGGFLATNDLAVKQYVGICGGPHIYSNGLSPVQAGVALAALRIARSPEGDALRASAAANIALLRGLFAERGVPCLGDPSNIVSVVVGDERAARWTSRLLEERGLMVNLVEYPAVGRGAARFRFQVMASHTPAHVRSAVALFCDALADARAAVLS